MAPRFASLRDPPEGRLPSPAMTVKREKAVQVGKKDPS